MNDVRTEVQLGDKAKDKITGFQGIVAAVSDWISGCRRIGLQSQELKDGKPIEVQWFDVEHVEVVNMESVTPAVPSGGPESAPTRNTDPVR